MLICNSQTKRHHNLDSFRGMRVCAADKALMTINRLIMRGNQFGDIRRCHLPSIDVESDAHAADGAPGGAVDNQDLFAVQDKNTRGGLSTTRTVQLAARILDDSVDIMLGAMECKLCHH